MLNVKDWNSRKEAYELYWNKQNQAPLLAVTAPIDKSRVFKKPSLEEQWFDEVWELMDRPKALKKVLKENVSLYKQVFKDYYPLTAKYQGGTTNWLSVYSESPSYFISIDFIVMISDHDFMEFVEEHLRDLARFHERVFLHLDGENAVRHLDRILAVEDIDAVQVQATPLAHTAKLWLPYIQRIQEKGKGVHIEARTLEDVQLLKRECTPEGMFIKMYCDDIEQAKRAEEIVYG